MNDEGVSSMVKLVGFLVLLAFLELAYIIYGIIAKGEYEE